MGTRSNALVLQAETDSMSRFRRCRLTILSQLGSGAAAHCVLSSQVVMWPIRRSALGPLLPPATGIDNGHGSSWFSQSALLRSLSRGRMELDSLRRPRPGSTAGR